MVRLLRVLIRLLFRVAAVAALVWIGRELMRRWVDGPEQPQVAGDWEARRPQPVPAVSTEAGGGGGSALTPGAEPAKKGRAKKAVAPVKPAARVKPATPAEAPGAVEVGGGLDPEGETQASVPSAEDPPAGTPAVGPAPAKRRQRPLKATRIPKDAPTAKDAPTKSAAKSAPAKASPGAGSAWVSPNGSGDAPSTHPVKAKLVSRLYRVPGMPMYNRTVPDRCYTTPEAAEADGFTRAAR